MHKLTEREFTWGIWIIVIITITAMSLIFGPESGHGLGWRWDF